MTNKKTVLIIVLYFLVVLAVGIFVVCINAQNELSRNYRWAIEEIKDGDYYWALHLLEVLKEKDYKDSEYLYYYMQSLNTNNSYIAVQHIEKIPDDYNGIFCYDISLEKVNYVERCENERRIIAHKEQAEREAKEKLKDEISKKIPYVGMSTEFINDTVIGKYDEHESYNGKTRAGKYTVDKYKWMSEDFRGRLVLYAQAQDGIVVDVTRYGENIYWTKDGKPDFANKVKDYSSGYSGSSKKNSSDDDKYDTSRFDWAEDFYDFYYYDFRDFDEAKDYYEKHKQ